MHIALVWIFLLALLAGACGQEATSTPSASPRLVEAGWSFGFCLGPCNGTLVLDGERLTYRVRNREGNEVLASSQGRLTPSGSARLSVLVSELPAQLENTYGCPDCADAGAAYVVLERDGTRQRSEYEYPSPPPELGALDAFLKEVMDALGRCESTSAVAVTGECSPVPR